MSWRQLHREISNETKRITRQFDNELTLLSNDCHNSILIDKLHRLHAAFIDSSHHINTPDPALTIRRSIQQGGLEVSIQFGVQFPIVAEENANSFLRIDAANLEIGTQSMLDKVAMVRGNLKAVGAPDLHQTLITRLSSNGVGQLLPHLENITRRVEIGVEEGFAACERCNMTYTWS